MHRRIIVVETMGRTSGWIALGGGLASLADAILIPERPLIGLIWKLIIKSRNQKLGPNFVVSEGAAQKWERPIAFEVKDSPQKERFGGFWKLADGLS